MKAYLLFKNRDFNIKEPLPVNHKELIQDLGLDILFDVMAAQDEFIFKVVSAVPLLSLSNDLATVVYRQGILKDCLANIAEVKTLYDITVAGAEARKNSWLGVFSSYPTSILSGSVDIMQVLIDILKQLRQFTDEVSPRFKSEGFKRFFKMIAEQLTDEYFQTVDDHLADLKLKEGTLMSAQLSEGNKGDQYTLHRLPTQKHSWWEWLFPKKPEGFVFSIHPRDESGIRALSELNNRSVNLVANAVAQSVDHILGFFNLLRTEFAFYVGCINLKNKLDELGEPVCIPEAHEPDSSVRSFSGLYDVNLSLSMQRKIVANDLEADGKNLVIITGANQGGKSTFLRSVGLSQLMMQSGMFVCAKSYRGSLSGSLFTHFKRKEDAQMVSGKFDEELNRMSGLIDQIKPHAMILFNESFASTNDREGSEIARQIVSALLEKNVKIFFVTHLYQFANSFYQDKKGNTVFLRPERTEQAKRTFKVVAGNPQQTSYGEDLYHRIFENDIKAVTTKKQKRDIHAN